MQKFPHPKYGKIVKAHKKYLVHVEKDLGDVKVGDEVVIEEFKPVSKMKKWKLIQVINKK